MSIYSPSSIPIRIPFVSERGFNFIKSIRITNRTTKLTAYQIEVDLNTSNFAFEKARSDGADIRFRDMNGEALSYWIESWTSTSAKIWVKLDELEDYEERFIYMVYGNYDATTESDGDGTFILFDDFEGNSIDSEKWDYINVPSVSDSKARFNGIKDLKSASLFDFPQPVAITIYTDIDAFDTGTGNYAFLLQIVDRNDVVAAEGARWYPEGAFDRYVYGVSNTFWAGINKGAILGENRHTHINIPPSKFSWKVLGTRTFDDTKTDVDNFPTCSTRYCHLATGYSLADIYVYWIMIRKYVEIEPSIEIL